MKWLSLCLACLAGPATALSCLPVDVASAYRDADESEAQYVVVLGSFSFAPEALPRRDAHNDNPPSTLVDAQFSGHSFSGASFTAPGNFPVTIDAKCFAAWCGWMAPDVETLAFLKKQDGGYHLSVSPCGGLAFPEPTREQVNMVTACYRGKDCVSIRDEWD